MKSCQAPMMAQRMEVSQSRGSQLYRQFQVAGAAGRVMKPATGAPPKLTTEPRAQLPELLSKEAEYYGLEGAVWTRLRVGEVMKPHLGVNYPVSTRGRLLKPLGLILPKPTLCSYRQHWSRVALWQEETLAELTNTAHQRTNGFFL